MRSRIVFSQMNLVSDWRLRAPCDVIFCRNVVIYFDKDTQRRLFDRIAESLIPGGYLYIGHAENLFQVSSRFELAGQTVYKRIQ